MIFTPDERRALIALGGLLALGLLVRLAVREPLPPPGWRRLPAGGSRGGRGSAGGRLDRRTSPGTSGDRAREDQ